MGRMLGLRPAGAADGRLRLAAGAAVRAGVHMPLQTSEALILRTYRLGEADRLVVFLTRDRGKKRGVARSAQRSRRRFGGALEPLTQVRLAYVEREHRDLVRLEFAEPVRSPLSAAADAGALAHAEYFAELLDECAQRDEPAETLFRLGAATLEALAAGADVAALARYFEYWLLRFQGVYPALGACGRCGGKLGPAGASLAADGHAFVCGACLGRTTPELSPAALAWLSRLATLRPAEAAALAPAAAVREVERVHRALIRRHLEREPRSVRVLRDMGAAEGRNPADPAGPAGPMPAAEAGDRSPRRPAAGH
jgi:DNA repair protein RecO (recombination protein O)